MVESGDTVWASPAVLELDSRLLPALATSGARAAVLGALGAGATGAPGAGFGPAADSAAAMLAAVPPRADTVRFPPRRAPRDDGVPLPPLSQALAEDASVAAAAVADVVRMAAAPAEVFPLVEGGRLLAALHAVSGRPVPWPPPGDPYLMVAELDAGVDLWRFVRPDVRAAPVLSAGCRITTTEAARSVFPTLSRHLRHAPMREDWVPVLREYAQRRIVEPYSPAIHGQPILLHPVFLHAKRTWRSPPVPSPEPSSPWHRSFDPLATLGDTRPILDARALNLFLDPPPFRYTEHAAIATSVSTATSLAVADVAKGFYAVLIAPSSRRLLGISSPSGELYVFRRLPFGLAVSPFLFSLVSAVLRELVLALARARGIRAGLEVFVDDFLVTGATQADAARMLLLLRAVGAGVGLAFPTSKVQDPSPSASYVGFTWSTGTRGASYAVAPSFAARFVPALATLYAVVCRRRAAPRALVASVVGGCMWLARGYPEGRPYIRGLARSLYSPAPRGHVWLRERRTLADLTFWLTFVGTPLPVRSVTPVGDPVVVVSDAGAVGAAALVVGPTRRCFYHLQYPPWLPPDSTSRELFGAVGALVAFSAPSSAALQASLTFDSASAAFWVLSGSAPAAWVSVLLAALAARTWARGGSTRVRWVPRSSLSLLDAAASDPAFLSLSASTFDAPPVRLDAAWASDTFTLPSFDLPSAWSPLGAASLSGSA